MYNCSGGIGEILGQTLTNPSLSQNCGMKQKTD